MNLGTKIILSYQLDDESLDYLETVCKGISLPIDWSSIRMDIPLVSEVEVDVNNQHSAFVDNAGIYYNPDKGWSDFALIVTCPDLTQALSSKGELALTLPLVRNMMAVDRKKKAMINSVCTTFYNDKKELTLINGTLTKEAI